MEDCQLVRKHKQQHTILSIDVQRRMERSGVCCFARVGFRGATKVSCNRRVVSFCCRMHSSTARHQWKETEVEDVNISVFD